jgi:hypothetical protein
MRRAAPRAGTVLALALALPAAVAAPGAADEIRSAPHAHIAAALHLAAPGTVPLMCMAPPIDSASGNLSLPGRIR